MKKFSLFRSIVAVSPLLLLHPDALAVQCALDPSSSEIWDTGFKAEYIVTNDKSHSISQWSVQLAPFSSSLQTNWNSMVVNTSSPLTFANAPWNGTIAPGATARFGLQGNKSGSFNFPACVDAFVANMEVPEFSDPSPMETLQSGGFAWQSIAGAVRYEIQKFSLDDAGQPVELLSSASTENTGWGFSDSSIGHFGWRVRQCNADDDCSAFSDFKRIIKYQLHAKSLNRVTGTYEIEWKSPFADSVLLEDGAPVSDAAASGTLAVRDKESGTYTYALTTQTSTFVVEIDRFDPDMDPDRSLMIHDEATLAAVNISLRAVFDRFAAQLSAENPTDPVDGPTLFARMWDAQNSADTSLQTGAAPCEPEHLGDAVDCPRSEAAQAADPTLFLSRYVPIAMVNRLDLRDRAQHQHCGEARMIYALPGNLGGRNFIILEAQLPNPTPGVANGCQPIANFWHQLGSINSPLERGQKLRAFYLSGLPGAAMPVLEIENFMANSGQIRTNQFSDFAQGWNLKEYKISLDNGFNTLAVTTVKNNPMASLFNMENGTEFLQQFSNNVLSLVGNISFISMPPFDDRFNNVESHASGNIEENQFRDPFEVSKGSSFESRIFVLLDNVRSDLTVDQVINRATAMTCGGCHQPSSFGLTLPDAVGPGLSWPESGGFVHVNENAIDGVFPLSPALTDVFLPDRLEALETYLSTGVEAQPEEPVQNVDDAESTPDINNGDRSG